MLSHPCSAGTARHILPIRVRRARPAISVGLLGRPRIDFVGRPRMRADPLRIARNSNHLAGQCIPGSCRKARPHVPQFRCATAGSGCSRREHCQSGFPSSLLRSNGGVAFTQMWRNPLSVRTPVRLFQFATVVRKSACVISPARRRIRRTSSRNAPATCIGSSRPSRTFG